MMEKHLIYLNFDQSYGQMNGFSAINLRNFIFLSKTFFQKLCLIISSLFTKRSKIIHKFYRTVEKKT
jgi:hypothetical protein